MKNLQVKKEHIPEHGHLVAVVNDKDTVVVFAVFKDEETAAQIFKMLCALKDRVTNFDPPYYAFQDLCTSWRGGENAGLIKFKKHADE